LAKTKTTLEIGLAKWGEYEDQYKECSAWLEKTEALVRTYTGHVDTLEQKQKALEEFQVCIN
jgi:antibiotic biosynthesis monooxygenase (ABM) superfamily enzyme